MSLFGFNFKIVRSITLYKFVADPAFYLLSQEVKNAISSYIASPVQYNSVSDCGSSVFGIKSISIELCSVLALLQVNYCRVYCRVYLRLFLKSLMK